MQTDPRARGKSRAYLRPTTIALPARKTGAKSSQKIMSLALLSLPALASAAGFGKAQDMSWLGGNWYGVLAFFGIPAALGIICWVGVHSVLGARTRHERERQAGRRLPASRTARRPF